MGRLYISKIRDPEEFPKTRSINCFHPWIAKKLAALLNRIFSK